MQRGIHLVLLALMTSLALVNAAVCAHAEWMPNGTPVGGAGDFTDQWPATVAADGRGGAVVGWGGELALHASRLTESGNVAGGWPSDGVLLQQYPHFSFFPLTVGDEHGGAYVVFNALDCLAHCNLDPTEVRAQRITASGSLAPGWGSSGVATGSGFGPDPRRTLDYGNTVAIADGRRGVIIVWANRIDRNGRGPVELKAQRIDSTGVLLWGASGVVVRSTTAKALLQTACSDGRGGAFVFWQDERTSGVYGQHLNPSGEPVWRADGVPMTRSDFVALSRPVAVPDGERGCVVACVGATARDTGIFAARFTPDGNLPWRDVVQVTTASSVDTLRVVSCRTGGVILAWRNTRRTVGEEIFAQRIGLNGRTEWRRGGVPVCTALGHKDRLTLASDGHDGAYVAWADTRPDGEVFATHLDDDGRPVRGWARDGSPVCAAIAGVWWVQMVEDGAGGAMLAWTDDRRLWGENHRLKTTQVMRLLRDGPATNPTIKPPTSPRILATEAEPVRVGAGTFALRGMQPNPGPRGSVLQFALPEASPALLGLYDVAGRKLWQRDVGGLGAGEHSVRFADGLWLPPGVYLARLVQGERAATRRVAITR
jgi:hypothetical protein